MKIHCCNSGKGGFIFFMRYFTDSAILLLYSMLAFFYVPADQSLVFSLLFTVILGCVTYLCRTSETESWPYNSSTSAENLRKYPSGSCRKLCGFWVLFPVDYGSSSVFPTASVSDIICQTFSSGSGGTSILGTPCFSVPQVSGNSLSRRNLWFYPGVFSLVSYQAI